MADEAPKPTTGQILGMTVPASVERAIRTLGNVILMALIGAIPDVQNTVSAVIPPAYLPMFAAATALVFKQLRLSFPNAEWIKHLPV